MGRFNVRYPKARVSFQVEHWQALNRRLQAEEFEFFVADTRHFEADPQYRTSRLRPRRWHFCCREGHPLAARESVSAEELLSFPLATNISPPNIRKVLVDLSGRPDFRPAIECENGHSLLGVVLASDAIGISSGPATWRRRDREACVRCGCASCPTTSTNCIPATASSAAPATACRRWRRR